jgi:hypothetical protein
VNKKEFQDMEIRLENREQIGLRLADQLNAKIEENERLKKEVSILREYANALQLQLNAKTEDQ